MNKEIPTLPRNALYGPLDGGCRHWAPIVRQEIAAPADGLAVLPSDPGGGERGAETGPAGEVPSTADADELPVI